jgi:hypothetical protein
MKGVSSGLARLAMKCVSWALGRRGLAHSPIRQVRLIGSTASIAADWFAHKTNIIEPAKPRSGACAGDASGRRDKIFFLWLVVCLEGFL